MEKLLILLTVIFIISCTEAGTLEKVGEHDEFEVYKYYYEDGSYVYISKFKNQKPETVTWRERHGKATYTMGNILLENDSIVIIKKN